MEELETLRNQLVSTKDKAAQRAIATRIRALESTPRVRGPQGPRGPQGGSAVSEILSAPQSMLKEFVNPEGGGETWGFDAPIPLGSSIGIDMKYASPESAELAADIAIDPLDLVVGGLFKGAKVAGDIAGFTKDAGKGRQLSSFSNYVNNYYGIPQDFPEMSATDKEKIASLVQKLKGEWPTDIKKIPGVQKILDKYAAPIVERIEGLSEREQQIALEKSKGLLDTAVTGAKRIASSLFDVEDQAMWKQWGVNKANQNIIKGHLTELEKTLKTGETGGRWQAKALSQGHYLNHILRQSGRDGQIHPAVQALADVSNLESYIPSTPGTVASLMMKHGANEYDTAGKLIGDVRVSPEDARYIEQHVQQATGNPDLITMKRPEQAASGKHKFDVLGQKNHGYRAVESAFKDLIRSGTEITDETLGAALNKVKNKKGQKSFTVEPAEGGGYWVSNGTNASAITEGGINSLIKVTPDGQLMGVMSDRHDWFEKAMQKASKAINKIPGVNMDVEKVFLENSLAAVTPPMYKNVYESFTVDKARKAAGEVPGAFDPRVNPRAASSQKGEWSPLRPNKKQTYEYKGPTQKVARGSDYAQANSPYITGLLEDVVNIKPTRSAVASEQLNRLGLLTGTASGYQKLDGNDE